MKKIDVVLLVIGVLGVLACATNVPHSKHAPGSVCPEDIGGSACSSTSEAQIACVASDAGATWTLALACDGGDICYDNDIDPYGCRPPPTHPTATSSSSSSGGGCCKHCGSDSKPCGDSCIALSKQCSAGVGCACR